MSLVLKSQVIITASLEDTISQLQSLQTNQRIITIVEEKKAFSVDDAKEAIAKAYIASEVDTILILGAKVFSTVVQNKLLKIIEEPPSKTEFILVTNSKSTILPTIKSRLPVTVLSSVMLDDIDIPDVKTLNLATVYEFSQKHKREDAKSMKLIIQKLIKEAIKSNLYNLDKKSLDMFGDAYKVLDLGSPTQFVLHTVLLKLLARKKR